MSAFQEAIFKFNAMYKLPVAPVPSTKYLGVAVSQRLTDLKSILLEEVKEIDEIFLKAVAKEDGSLYVPEDNKIEPYIPSTLEILTDIADLMGDLQVYCASEMTKFGLPVDKVLDIIMQSNFSKQFSDGPHHDERGKVLKGPHYWKPEPKISAELVRLIAEAEAVKQARTDAHVHPVSSLPDPAPL